MLACDHGHGRKALALRAYAYTLSRCKASWLTSESWPHWHLAKATTTIIQRQATHDASFCDISKRLWAHLSSGHLCAAPKHTTAHTQQQQQQERGPDITFGCCRSLYMCGRRLQKRCCPARRVPGRLHTTAPPNPWSLPPPHLTPPNLPPHPTTAPTHSSPPPQASP